MSHIDLSVLSIGAVQALSKGALSDQVNKQTRDKGTFNQGVRSPSQYKTKLFYMNSFASQLLSSKPLGNAV